MRGDRRGPVASGRAWSRSTGTARSAGFAGHVGAAGTAGTSVVHRATVPTKLASLAVLGVATVALHGPVPAATLLLVTVGLALLARLPRRTAFAGLRPVVAVVVVLGAVQWWQRGWMTAVEAAADLTTLVLGATVVLATSSIDDLLDTVVRASAPLRRVGLQPELVALTVMLMLRTVPALLDLTAEVRDAARARGLGRHPRALLVPMAIRTVARARATGEALAARGIGDEPRAGSTEAAR
ncbi:MAG: energy-coupling factor transporter transmembrane component T family protein [Cellulomonas sp.]